MSLSTKIISGKAQYTGGGDFAGSANLTFSAPPLNSLNLSSHTIIAQLGKPGFPVKEYAATPAAPTAVTPRTKPYIAKVTQGEVFAGQPSILSEAGWNKSKGDARALVESVYPDNHPDVAHMEHTLQFIERFRHEEPMLVLQSILKSYRENEFPDWTLETPLENPANANLSWNDVRDRQYAYAQKFKNNKHSPSSRLRVAQDVPEDQRQILQKHIDDLHRNPAGAAVMKLVDELPFDIEYRPGTEGAEFVNRPDQHIKPIWDAQAQSVRIAVVPAQDAAVIYGPRLDNPLIKSPLKNLDGSEGRVDPVTVLAHELADQLKIDEYFAKQIFQIANWKGGEFKVKNPQNATEIYELRKKIEQSAKLEHDMQMHFEAASIQIEQLVQYWSNYTQGAAPMALRFPVYVGPKTFPAKVSD